MPNSDGKTTGSEHLQNKNHVRCPDMQWLVSTKSDARKQRQGHGRPRHTDACSIQAHKCIVQCCAKIL